MPKVSVIVPVYNVEPYLRACMDSIVRQTLKDIEIICINDGSTDGSLAILKEFAALDKRITIVDKENGGSGMAMNIGLDRATGEYIGIVEPDDFIALNMYEDLYLPAKEHKLDFIKADFYKFETNEKEETETYTYAHLSQDLDDYGFVFKPMEKLSSFFWIMNTWSGIYRLEFLREKGIRHQETPGAAFQDNGFWFQTFLYAERAMIIHRPLYRVRRDNPNSSVRNPSKVYAINMEYDYIKGILRKDPETWEKIKGVYWRKRFHNYNATLKRIAPSFVEEYQRQIGKELRWGMKRGEFRAEDFRPGEWNQAQNLMKGQVRSAANMDPTDRDELNLILNSRSYKLGRKLTAIPRKARSLVRRVVRK